MLRTRGTVFVLLGCLLLHTVLAPMALAADDGAIRAYRERLDAMEQEMQELRERLRTLEAERQSEQSDAAESVGAPAAKVAAPEKDQVQDEQLGILATEVERLKSRLILPDAKEYKSVYGFGPAASKVYQIDRGLSIGGYGEFNYQNFVKNEPYYPDALIESDDFQRAVIPNIPTGKVADAEETAELALYLASDRCTHMVGQVIPWAGGWVTSM